MPERLDRDRLNTILLERHLLRRRRRIAPLDVIERLVGLQAQEPRDPYVALWTRLARFDPTRLSDAMGDRRVVRMTLMRGTLHTVTAGDAVSIRPVVQPVIEQTLTGQRAFREAFAGVDLDEVTSWYAELLGDRAMTRSEVARATAGRYPEADASNLAYGMYRIPLVQVTPRGLWRTPGKAAFTTLDGWIGRGVDRVADPDRLVRRYLATFGPATVADFQSWSGLRGTNEVFDELRPSLRTFVDDRRRELFDVDDAPRPRTDRDVPVRFLPEYDNVFIGHADRSRIVPDGVKPWTEVGWGLVLIDGFVGARWKLDPKDEPGVLRVEPFGRVPRDRRSELEAEGVALTTFLTDGEASPRIHIVRSP